MLIGSQIQEHIVNDINKDGRWFSVTADKVQDVSNKEQLAICVCYSNDDCKFVRKISPSKLYTISSCNNVTIFKTVIKQ